MVVWYYVEGVVGVEEEVIEIVLEVFLFVWL